jgi:ABC-2 type transport system ATP-binding protein
MLIHQMMNNKLTTLDLAPDDPCIEIRSLDVRRGDRTVLHDLGLSIGRGMVTGLLGPSGCGKTTLLRAIVGSQVVASGEVTVLGAPAGSAALRRRVGYVTQDPSVYADLTVAENLRYFGRILDVPASRDAEVLQVVGLTGERDRVVGRLSGGQRARVSLATALLGEPELLVLDEPTVGLDPLLRRDLWGFFGELAAGGTTLLVSSHVMDEAERCDTLLLMRDGRIIARETPDSLRARTGADGLDEAFLRLVEQAGGEGAA